MRITQIVCTLGPACDNKTILKKMNDAGMNIARLNMSHGTHESHQALIDKLSTLRQKGKVKLMVDTKGPEIRIGSFKDGSAILKTGQQFIFTSRNVEGDETQVSLRYKDLVKQVKPGDKIYANDGIIVLHVNKVTPEDIITTVEFGGKLSNHKSLNVPNVIPLGPYLSPADKLDLNFAIKNQADYIALSFVSEAQNVKDVRKYLNARGGRNIKLIAKIENAKGVNNAEEILDESDGLMVARGDLGVEIPLQKIPPVQKKLISLCNAKRKFVIVATEMLESMTNSTRPTRAEVSDVANAIYEEANATMLSGETSIGINPILVVQTMGNIIDEIEKYVYNMKLDY